MEKYSNIGIANISICETDFIDERVDELQREINFEKLLEKEFGDTGTIEFEISNLLSSLGLSPKHSGYAYLRHCILNIVLNNGIISSLNTEQYPIVASTFKTNTINVERNIRNAIFQAWERYGKENWAETFALKTLKDGKRPTNREFIYMCSEIALSRFKDRLKPLKRSDIYF